MSSKKVYATRAKNATAHPGAPDLPKPRRSAAEVAEERRLQAIEDAANAASNEALAKRILELEAEKFNLEKQVATALGSTSTVQKPRGRRSKKGVTPAVATTNETAAKPAPKVVSSLINRVSEDLPSSLVVQSRGRTPKLNRADLAAAAAQFMVLGIPPATSAGGKGRRASGGKRKATEDPTGAIA